MVEFIGGANLDKPPVCACVCACYCAGGVNQAADLDGYTDGVTNTIWADQ